MISQADPRAAGMGAQARGGAHAVPAPEQQPAAAAESTSATGGQDTAVPWHPSLFFPGASLTPFLWIYRLKCHPGCNRGSQHSLCWLWLIIPLLAGFGWLLLLSELFSSIPSLGFRVLNFLAANKICSAFSRIKPNIIFLWLLCKDKQLLNGEKCDLQHINLIHWEGPQLIDFVEMFLLFKFLARGIVFFVRLWNYETCAHISHFLKSLIYMAYWREGWN